MTLLEFALKINEKIKRAQQNKDAEYKQSTELANFMPSFILQPLAMTLTYLCTAVGINIPSLGFRNDQSGHIIVTNIGGNIGY